MPRRRLPSSPPFPVRRFRQCPVGSEGLRRVCLDVEGLRELRTAWHVRAQMGLPVEVAEETDERGLVEYIAQYIKGFFYTS